MHRLRNTYVIFTSDNGFFFGEHRLIGGKFLAYEPSTHLPFLIRGPHIRPGSRTDELAGTSTSPRPCSNWPARKRQEHRRPLDGAVPADPDLRTPAPEPLRVLRRILRRRERARSPNRGDQSSRQTERPGSQGRGASASILAPPKDYEGIRLGPYKYIAWPDGEKELYNLEKDPYELNNIVRIPNYFPVRNFLHHELLNRLEDCVGRTCREEARKSR